MSDWQGLALRMFRQVRDELTAAVTAGALDRPSRPDANSAAWLVWHIARGQDRNLSEIAGLPQVYVEQGWATRFGRPADPSDTGYGHTPAQASAFRGAGAPGAAELLGYLDAVHERVERCLTAAPAGDLARIAPSPTLGTAETVEARLAAQLADSLAHLGQLGTLAP
ncbi:MULTISPECIES: DinB family protein [unclassified Streptomyces]|uniref:DinB family protein n=1 Tax=unclassified Streptomyces TaxID=2593676 RepID=UPI00225AEEA3|nr:MULTISPECIES: DinB family protein [unclassified Streptomyces]MCX4527880.1 DinB family protein [Streptomyces sp. NBC_01551]MCX4541522.1 DinB family protein [Streptomyces sp. NBC_01565]